MNKESSKIDVTRLQGIIAVASFCAGVLIACVCICLIKPYGEITNSAISIVSELLCLCGALLGIKVNYDTKLSNFRSEMEEKLKHKDE